MNPQVALRLTLERLSRASGQQRALRAVVGLGSAAFVALVVAAGGGFRPLLTIALVALALFVMALPDSSGPLFLVAALGWLWVTSVRDPTSAWTLLAAVDLMVVHIACAVASYGPPQLVVDVALLRLWVRRGLLLAAVTTLVWLVARVAAGLDLSPSGPLTAVALGLLLGWVALVWRRLVTRDAA